MKILKSIKANALTKEELKNINAGKSPAENFYICTYAQGGASIVGVTSNGALVDYINNHNAACLAGQEIVGCRHISQYI